MAVWQAMEQSLSPDSVTDREQGGAVWQYVHMVIPRSSYNFLKFVLRSCHGGCVAGHGAHPSPDSVTDLEQVGKLFLGICLDVL